VFALALAGCLKPDLVPCGDKLCARDAVCLPNGTCASPDAVAACANMPDGTACTVNAFTGSCRDGVCAAPVCGDGQISGAEQCDGPVTDIDCVDLGFDLGVPACNARCDLDFLASCTRFGWRRVHAGPVQQAAIDNNGRLAWITPANELQVDGVGLVTTHGSLRDLSTNRAGAFVALTNDEVVLVDGNIPTSLGLPPDGDAVRVVIDPDRTVYTMDADDCMLYAKPLGGAWTQIRSMPSEDCNDLSIDLTDHSLLLAIHTATNTGRVERWNGAVWSTVTSPSAEALEVMGRDGAVWVGLAFGGAIRIDATGTTQLFGNDYIFQIRDVGPYTFVNGNGPIRIDEGDRTEQLSQPTDGELLSDGAHLFVAGNGIYEYTGTSFAGRNGRTVDVYTITLATDGTPFAGSEFGASWPAPDTRFDWITRPMSLQPFAIAARSFNEIYATDHTDLKQWDGNSLGQITPPGFAGINGLALVGSKLYAVGDSGLAMVRDSGTWSTLPAGAAAGCDFHAIAHAAGNVFACGACGTVGALWQLSGSTWIELHRGGGVLDALALTSEGDAIAAGMAGGGWWRSGAWLDVPQAIGVSVSATTRDDVWVAGGPDDVLHFDGMVWSRLRVEGTSKPRVVATPHAVYFAGVQLSTLVR
jgi:hypothetical protein